MDHLAAILVGFGAWFFVRYGLGGFYTVSQSQRAVKTSFGRAQRIEGKTSLHLEEATFLSEEESDRYDYPQVRVIPPGGPYFKWPWEKVYKVSIATETISMARDPESPRANNGGELLEAVTKDQLNTVLRGPSRWSRWRSTPCRPSPTAT